MPTSREIICADAFVWLPANMHRGAIVTGLPDMAELGMQDVAGYHHWFQGALTHCMQAVTKGQPAIFCQTDRKANGGIVSKAAWMVEVANQCGKRLL
jgi:hypothetical protein